MIGQAEVVVDAPHQHFLPSESHLVGDVPFQLGKGEVAVGVLGVLAKRATVIADSVKDVQNVWFC